VVEKKGERIFSIFVTGKSGGRRQNSEVRRRKPEFRRQKTEAGIQKTEDGSQNVSFDETNLGRFDETNLDWVRFCGLGREPIRRR
jgi:hypothetical protein